MKDSDREGEKERIGRVIPCEERALKQISRITSSSINLAIERRLPIAC